MTTQVRKEILHSLAELSECFPEVRLGQSGRQSVLFGQGADQ